MKNNTINLGEAITEFLSNYHLDNDYSKARIENSWYQITGKYLSKHTRKVRFNNGILTISIDSAAIRNELMYAREDIKQKINNSLGDNIVKEIKIY